MEKPKPYPVECLGVLRDVVVAICDETGVSKATSAATVLSSASLLAQKDYCTKTLGNDTHLSLFFLVLVPSGGRKSSALELSLRAHIQSNEDLVRRHTATVDHWNRQREGLGNGDAAPLVLQRRFLSLVSFEVKIASLDPMPQSCQGCGVIAKKWFQIPFPTNRRCNTNPPLGVAPRSAD